MTILKETEDETKGDDEGIGRVPLLREEVLWADCEDPQEQLDDKQRNEQSIEDFVDIPVTFDEEDVVDEGKKDDDGDGQREAPVLDD